MLRENPEHPLEVTPGELEKLIDWHVFSAPCCLNRWVTGEEKERDVTWFECYDHFVTHGGMAWLLSRYVLVHRHTHLFMPFHGVARAA